METLPAELRLHICGLLDREDLSSVRLVNKTWSHLTAWRTFEQITITPLSLERLKPIAQHEVIAKCVKSITFHADFLSMTLLEVGRELLFRRSRTWTMEETSFHFQTYVFVYQEQQCLRENHYKLYKEILDLSIPMLRRLQCLKFEIGGNRRPEYLDTYTSRPNQLWSNKWYHLVRHGLGKFGVSRREFEISRQFTHLLNALASSDIEIGELSLRGNKTSVWPGVLQLRQESYCAGLTALKTITLESSCISGHLHNSANRHCEVKTLGLLLEEAHNLQTLTLHGEARPHILTDFLMCFRPSLPKLSNLCLFGIATSDQNLIDSAGLPCHPRKIGPIRCPAGSWQHCATDGLMASFLLQGVRESSLLT